MNLATMSHATLLASYEAFANHMADGRIHRSPGVMTMQCDVDFPPFNAACVQTNAVGEAAIADGLKKLQGGDYPFSVLFPTDPGEPMASFLESYGLTKDDPTPLMTATEPSNVAWPEELTLDNSPEAMERHRQLMVDIFDLPHTVIDPVVSPHLWDDDNVHTVVGLDGDVPVTTALSVKVGEGLGVFNVGTHPDYRGRGYGAAATAAVTDQGFAEGATIATLQSSPMGVSVYEALGFRHVLDQARWSKVTA